MPRERDELGFDAGAPVGHPGRKGLPAGHSTGPEIGDKLPDFELPEARGGRVSYHADRGNAPSVVLFFRSVIW